jgi:hypothetical protein
VNLVPSILLIAAWSCFTAVSIADRDYFAAAACLTVIGFGVLNVALMRNLDKRIAAQREHIAAQREHIATLDRLVLAPPKPKTSPTRKSTHP